MVDAHACLVSGLYVCADYLNDKINIYTTRKTYDLNYFRLNIILHAVAVIYLVGFHFGHTSFY